MIRAVATGVAGYLSGFALSFGLLACGGKTPCPTRAADGADRAPRVTTCEVRR